jgi:NAD(P)-dependent dehydrogenase (short-subunit alcohol dehydrogenase family)
MADTAGAAGTAGRATTAEPVQPLFSLPRAEDEGAARTVVVTGASRGIGAAVARRAAAAGWDVLIAYRHRREQARSVVDQVHRQGRRAFAVQADVSDPAQVERLFVEADRFGGLAGLVNNAGVTGGLATVEDVRPEQVREAFATNVEGTILCTQAALRRLSCSRGGSGGVIVNISSTAARTGGTGEWVHYAASKAAVNCFTVGAAREAAGDGVRIVAVAPGLVMTDLHADNGVPDRPERLAPTVPAGRAGTPAEIANTVVWALSDEASYLVGSVIEVGGGR